MKSSVIVTVAVLVASSLALAAGAAAVAPPLLAPDGVSAGPGVATAPMPAPTYSTNGSGQTYGSAADANSPDTEPDLIRVVSNEGGEGYVRKTDLDDADGTTAAASFTSPADALAWQAGPGSEDHTITVYAVDGVTPIGTFTVQGSAHQGEPLG